MAVLAQSVDLVGLTKLACLTGLVDLTELVGLSELPGSTEFERLSNFTVLDQGLSSRLTGLRNQGY